MRPRTLKSAAEAGDIDAIVYHLARGEKINARTAAGHFPLGGAIIKGHSHVVRFLIEHGADVDMKSEFGWSPLYLAAWTGNAEIAKLLLAAGARIHSKTIASWNSPDGYTPLHIAAMNGSLKVVKLLIAAGARINAKNGLGQTALDVALEHDEKKVARFLRSYILKSSKNASS